MELKSFANPLELKEAVFPFLFRNEAANCLCLGIIETLISRPQTFPEAHLWAVYDQGQIVGAAWLTPPRPFGLTKMPDAAIPLLVAEAARRNDQLDGVIGAPAQAGRFRDLWINRSHQSIKSSMAQRIYQVSEVKLPRDITGLMRRAVADDQRLLEEWMLAFSSDCGLHENAERIRASAIRVIEMKSHFLWEHEGRPLAMAGAGGATPSGIRITWVYTPRELRRLGYASALVATLSHKMLSEGKKFCFLYTDLANPTSNSIYQRIGYREVCDSSFHQFNPLGRDNQAPIKAHSSRACG